MGHPWRKFVGMFWAARKVVKESVSKKIFFLLTKITDQFHSNTSCGSLKLVPAVSVSIKYLHLQNCAFKLVPTGWKT